jgi:hypothetical protein
VAATLTIIYWRDIPAQVIARDGDRTHKVVLHPRFQVAIDRAAMTAGKAEFDDYIGEWRRESEPCGDDVEATATERAARLEADFGKDVLAAVAANGGLRATADT